MTTWHRIRKPLLLAAAAATVVTAAVAAGGHDPAPAPAAAPLEKVYAEGLAALPSDSLSDWTSYADYVVDAVATRVDRSRLTADEIASGEGLAVRLVTMQVSEILWTSPTAHPQPATLVIPDGGYLLKPDKPERQLVTADTVTLEVGHHYLMPIFYDQHFHPAWQGLNAATFLPFDDGVAGRGTELIGADRQPVTALKAAADPRDSRRTLWGRNAPTIRASLAAAKPDPVAANHADLPPSVRYQTALREHRSTQK